MTNWGEVTSIMAAQIDLSPNGGERDAQVVSGETVRQVNPLIQEGQWRSG